MGNQQSNSWNYTEIQYIPYNIYNTTEITHQDYIHNINTTFETIPNIYHKNINTIEDKIKLILQYNTFIELINELSIYDTITFIEYHYNNNNKHKYKYKWYFNGIQQYITFTDLSSLKTYIQDYKHLNIHKNIIDNYILNNIYKDEIKLNNIYEITNLEVLKHYITKKFDLTLKYYIDNFTIVFKKNYK
jgi:hypothetical protein